VCASDGTLSWRRRLLDRGAFLARPCAKKEDIVGIFILEGEDLVAVEALVAGPPLVAGALRESFNDSTTRWLALAGALLFAIKPPRDSTIALVLGFWEHPTLVVSAVLPPFTSLAGFQPEHHLGNFIALVFLALPGFSHTIHGLRAFFSRLPVSGTVLAQAA